MHRAHAIEGLKSQSGKQDLKAAAHNLEAVTTLMILTGKEIKPHCLTITRSRVVQ